MRTGYSKSYAAAVSLLINARMFATNFRPTYAVEYAQEPNERNLEPKEGQ